MPCGMRSEQERRGREGLIKRSVAAQVKAVDSLFPPASSLTLVFPDAEKSTVSLSRHPAISWQVGWGVAHG